MDRLASFAEGNPDAIPRDMKCVACDDCMDGL